MAKEMAREGKVEPVGSPATPDMSDQRNYLFAEFKKSTSYPAGPPAPGRVGRHRAPGQAQGIRPVVSVQPRRPDWSVQRDDPAATTVELPPGTTPADAEAIKATAVPVGSPPPGDYRIEVQAINRGFMLDPTFLPGPSFVRWSGSEVLTPAAGGGPVARSVIALLAVRPRHRRCGGLAASARAARWSRARTQPPERGGPGAASRSRPGCRQRRPAAPTRRAPGDHRRGRGIRPSWRSRLLLRVSACAAIRVRSQASRVTAAWGWSRLTAARRATQERLNWARAAGDMRALGAATG